MLLMIPGPISLHTRVHEALCQPIIGHRTLEYRRILRSVVLDLQWILQTHATPFILTSSGTGAMDAAVANIICPGDTVINILGGKFGERLSQITTQYGAKRITIPVQWGNAVDLTRLATVLDENPDTKLVTFTHNETSTGVLQPAKEISRLVHKQTSAFLLADCVSNLGGDNVPQDKWKLDIIVSGSQKCLGVPPGLGIISVSANVWDQIRSRAPAPSYYFNLLRLKEKWDKDQDTPWTSAISLIRALSVSLQLIKTEGLEVRFQRHQHLAQMIRSGFQALGFSLFADPKYLSNTVTAFYYPPNIEGRQFLHKMKERGVLLAGSQHSDLMFTRIATMGECNQQNVLTTIQAATAVLLEMGMDLASKDMGVNAALDISRK